MQVVGLILKRACREPLKLLESLPCNAVLIDCRYVPTARTVEIVYELAKRGVSQGFGRARNFAVEVLRWYSGKRQIRDAIEVGFKPEWGMYVAAVECGEALNALRKCFDVVDAEKLIEQCFDPEATKRFYGITDAEIASSLGASVRERFERSIIARANTLFLE